MMRSSFLQGRIVLFLGALALLGGAVLEFYQIAWGTGEWLGLFSFKWVLIFLVFTGFCIFLQTLLGYWLFAPERLKVLFQPLVFLRSRLGLFAWVLAAVLAITPAWLFQFTDWGWIISKPFLRLTTWGLAAILVGTFLTRDKQNLLTWMGFLAGLTLTTASFVLAASLVDVTDYPFSLGWSEGNRLWDYSILFGSHLYDYSGSGSIPVYLDIGRQFTGGVPFLLPGLTIWQERLWLSLINSVPYLVLGWVAFRLSSRNFWSVFLAGIWAFMFVKQGPIHPPLLLCAIVVALARGRSLWIAVPLIVAASYFAEASRFTWLFAPGMWAAMLELSSASLLNHKLNRGTWARALAVGFAGILGGYLIPSYGPLLMKWIEVILGSSNEVPLSAAGGGLTPGSVAATVSDQPLLWYRLFPNATYGYGIIIGLFLAVFPLISLLWYFVRTRRWTLNLWQKLAVVLPLLAFLIVGLIASTKIGGGGDLHNLDMFLIGLMFAGAIAWQNGGRDWIASVSSAPAWAQVVLACLIALPGYTSLLALKPIMITGDLTRVMTLADIPPTEPLEILPSERDTNEALEDIRNAVAAAASQGEILFMDQRQLLTFGYIQGVPLIPEYDKKLLIDKALSADAQYFEDFYKDLAAQRFPLIISNPLHERIKTDSDDFGEENNAWVKWVSTPVLCYYEPLHTLRKVKVQLLVPRQDVTVCEQALP